MNYRYSLYGFFLWLYQIIFLTFMLTIFCLSPVIYAVWEDPLTQEHKEILKYANLAENTIFANKDEFLNNGSGSIPGLQYLYLVTGEYFALRFLLKAYGVGSIPKFDSGLPIFQKSTVLPILSFDSSFIDIMKANLETQGYQLQYSEDGVMLYIYKSRLFFAPDLVAVIINVYSYDLENYVFPLIRYPYELTRDIDIDGRGLEFRCMSAMGVLREQYTQLDTMARELSKDSMFLNNGKNFHNEIMNPIKQDRIYKVMSFKTKLDFYVTVFFEKMQIERISNNPEDEVFFYGCSILYGLILKHRLNGLWMSLQPLSPIILTEESNIFETEDDIKEQKKNWIIWCQEIASGKLMSRKPQEKSIPIQIACWPNNLNCQEELTVESSGYDDGKLLRSFEKSSSSNINAQVRKRKTAGDKTIIEDSNGNKRKEQIALGLVITEKQTRRRVDKETSSVGHRKEVQFPLKVRSLQKSVEKLNKKPMPNTYSRDGSFSCIFPKPSTYVNESTKTKIEVFLDDKNEKSFKLRKGIRRHTKIKGADTESKSKGTSKNAKPMTETESDEFKKTKNKLILQKFIERKIKREADFEKYNIAKLNRAGVQTDVLFDERGKEPDKTRRKNKVCKNVGFVDRVNMTSEDNKAYYLTGAGAFIVTVAIAYSIASNVPVFFIINNMLPEILQACSICVETVLPSVLAMMPVIFITEFFVYANMKKKSRRMNNLVRAFFYGGGVIAGIKPQYDIYAGHVPRDIRLLEFVCNQNNCGNEMPGGGGKDLKQCVEQFPDYLWVFEHNVGSYEKQESFDKGEVLKDPIAISTKEYFKDKQKTCFCLTRDNITEELYEKYGVDLSECETAPMDLLMKFALQKVKVSTEYVITIDKIAVIDTAKHMCSNYKKDHMLYHFMNGNDPMFFGDNDHWKNKQLKYKIATIFKKIVYSDKVLLSRYPCFYNANSEVKNSNIYNECFSVNYNPQNITVDYKRNNYNEVTIGDEDNNAMECAAGRFLHGMQIQNMPVVEHDNHRYVLYIPKIDGVYMLGCMGNDKVHNTGGEMRKKSFVAVNWINNGQNVWYNLHELLLDVKPAN